MATLSVTEAMDERNESTLLSEFQVQKLQGRQNKIQYPGQRVSKSIGTLNRNPSDYSFLV